MAIYFDYPSIQDYSAIVGISSDQFSAEYIDLTKENDHYPQQQQNTPGELQNGDKFSARG